MYEYHKIVTVWERDPETKHKYLRKGVWATDEFNFLKNCMWGFTEKVDGTNIRITFHDVGGILHFPVIKGKTDDAQIPVFLLKSVEKLVEESDWETVLEPSGVPITLYGEGYGAKIQKGGGNYRDDTSFVLFDMKIGDWWLKQEDMRKIGSQLGIEGAPLIKYGTLWDMVELVKKGFNSTWGDFLAEGIVARPLIELKDRAGKRVITKLKYKDFRR